MFIAVSFLIFCDIERGASFMHAFKHFNSFLEKQL